jgi:hypothetical protein
MSPTPEDLRVDLLAEIRYVQAEHVLCSCDERVKSALMAAGRRALAAEAEAKRLREYIAAKEWYPFEGISK